MAERRMFTKKITESDAFLDMSLSTQALYFHLSMGADDDGFVNSPKKTLRMIGAADDELKILLAKKFVIGFDSGIIVIKHWKMHNYIQKDRYKPTNHSEEMASLGLKGNNSYTLDTNCIQNVRVGKERIGKVSKGKVRLDEDSIDYSDATEVATYLSNKITDYNPSSKVKPDSWVNDIEKAIRIDNRTVTELTDLIDYIYKHNHFWIPNIMSGKKLRDKFDAISMQMKSKSKATKQSGYDDFLKDETDIIDTELY